MFSKNDVPTKRQVLSDIAHTFDILGWVSPVTVSLKIVLQRIWQLRIDWDKSILPELAETSITWRKDLPLVTAHAIPGYYHDPCKEKLTLQLHGFCDSSQATLAAVVYLRTVFVDTSVSTSMVIAKSRVTTVKTQTIPKLELCSAVLLS